ncbi:bifunctional C2 domain superfamily/Helicase [Babesia duncani]|uniref:Bifunctional C2 domain superfamily/Helicase n=1 Tax=Babesia duncani TaxID=323732 RepID=A0AAD9PN57_9APIC|nr:bifunctional C2 domain superfamily/Helicase [Babesia duncani]
MTENNRSLMSPYDLILPRDGYLLKHQVYRRFANQDSSHKREDENDDLGAAIECSFVDADDAGTLSWCIRNCKRICDNNPNLDHNKLVNDILVTIENDNNPDSIAFILAEVVNFEHLYFISKIIDFRKNILKQWHLKLHNLLLRLTTKESSHNDEYIRINKLIKNKFGKSIEQCKNRLESILSGIPPKELLELMDSNFQINQAMGTAKGFEKRITFNVTREDFEHYEKLTLPMTERTVEMKYDKLIPISELPEWAQIVFADIKQFNLIQSRVFEIAFNSCQNMLISAPTGCGKTNVALLCILQNFKQRFENGLPCGKAIYIAPMKALASEITRKFQKAILSLGLTVREVTSDTNIPKSELEEIDVMIVTPEKFDVLTRNSHSTGTQSDDSFFSRITCLIIDEIHLLNDDRGPVIEIIVARFFRLIESTQIIRRVVGISATLPNWQDVAQFLRVGPSNAFYFGMEYRHVPLQQIFYGVKRSDSGPVMIDICMEHIVETLEKEKQCIVFVHSRNETLKTATKLIDQIQQTGRSDLFCTQSKDRVKLSKTLEHTKFPQLKQLAEYSISIHHAGMPRRDRDLVENMFKEGLVKVLVSTSTLAWGVNLPAHCVIINGTFIGGIGVDRNINQLELTQIMGRAGRPQFDTSGYGILITEHKNLQQYVRMQVESVPIESQLHRHLSNALNAEIAIGTIKSESDTNTWLQYTYLNVRLFKNPLHYGINTNITDEKLYLYRKKIITEAAEVLCKSKLIRYYKKTGEFVSTDLGRIAARYYVDYETIHNFAASINPFIYFDKSHMNKDPENVIVNDEYILDHLCECREFENLLYRNEETDELLQLSNDCVYKPRSGFNHVKSKVSILIQSYISRIYIKTPSLVTDLNYLVQNVGRLLRAYFEVSTSETVSGPPVGDVIHKWMLMFERQIWDVKLHPLNVMRHFCYPYHALGITKDSKLSTLLSVSTVARLDGMFKLEEILDLTQEELTNVIRSKTEANKVFIFRQHIPYPQIKVYAQPLTNRITRVSVHIQLNHKWSTRWNGNSECFNVWICSEDRLMSSTKITLTNLNPYGSTESFIPVHDNRNLLLVKIFSCRWLGLVFEEQIIFPSCELKEDGYTTLKNLIPLPTTALSNPAFEATYNFKYFNPLQTQIFAQCYWNDGNMLVGAPTGSGKTVAAELGIFRLFNTRPNQKAVYIAPLKALAYERLRDWSIRFGGMKKVIEMTGDSYTAASEINISDIIITTPEKWDGVSRHWRRRKFVRSIGLIIIDEVHLLGEARGAVLESIVTRLGFISAFTGHNIRLICLSTALANPQHIGQWLSIAPCRLFNFSPAVRPVKCHLYIDGFPLKAYCPRMNSMNKPAFDTIMRHDPDSPVLIFVSSRRQTRTTAQDFIGLLQINSVCWSKTQIDYTFQDENLNHMVPYGIGIHHAGLHDSDRRKIETFFANGDIKVLIATSTLAWGVNLPAKIVFIKGTEYYDGVSKRYIDHSITDIMQMVGRAGRSLHDKEAFAYIYTETCKVGFFKAFLFSPFPIESHFHEKLVDNLNSLVATGEVVTKAKAMDYLKHTFLYKRLQSNVQYYTNIDMLSTYKGGLDADSIADALVTSSFKMLMDIDCIALAQNQGTCLVDQVYVPTILGMLASQYYISGKTLHDFTNKILDGVNISLLGVAVILSSAVEFSTVPLRHNEDCYNMKLSQGALVPIKESEAASPHAKTFLLLQAKLFHLEMPVFDYYNDVKSVMDQMPRIIQAFIDLVATSRNLKLMLCAILLYKCLVWEIDPRSLNLPLDDSIHLQTLVQVALASESNEHEIYYLDKMVHIPNSQKSIQVPYAKTCVIDVNVSLDNFNGGDSAVGYLIFANANSNVIYGFKKILDNSTKAKFRYMMIRFIRN